MSSDKNISAFDQFIRDKMEHAEMQAPDVWTDLSQQIVQPANGAHWVNSSLFKGVITTLVTGGVVAALWLNQSEEPSAVEQPAAKEVTVAQNQMPGTEPGTSGKTGASEPVAQDQQNANATVEFGSANSNRDGGSAEQTVNVNGEQTFNQTQSSTSTNAATRRESNTPSTPGLATQLVSYYNSLLNIYLSDTVVCKNDRCIVSTSNMQFFDRFWWEVDGVKMNDGISQFTYRPDRSNRVTITLYAVKDGLQCNTQRYIRVMELSSEPDMYILGEKRVRGIVNVKDVEKISWHFGDHSGWHESLSGEMDHQYDHYGVYSVKTAVMDKNGCMDTAVKHFELLTGVEVPLTVITPHGKDGKNDFFVVEGEDITNYRLTIRDISGTVLYESENIHDRWDGTDRGTGELVPTGTYIYQITYSQGNGPVKTTTGKLAVN